MSLPFRLPVELFSKNPGLQSAVNIAATSVLGIAAGYFILHGVVNPLRHFIGVTLPPSWHPFTDSAVKILFKDRLTYCEDIVMDHHHGIAILSEDPGRPQWNTVMDTMYDPNPRGTLHFFYYGSTKELFPVKLVNFPSHEDFHPLGINFHREGAGVTRLFVANHRRTGSTVDVFDLDYDAKEAVFVQSLSDGDKNILAPNAIAPTSYTSFYLTNDHYYIPRLNRIMNKVETVKALPYGWLTHVDFSTDTPIFMTVAEGIPFANGVVMTPTGKEVVVASTTGSELRIYDRDAATNKLSPVRERIPLRFGPDNVNFDDSLDVNDPTAFDQDGRFLRGVVCAGHPATLTLVAMAHQPDKYNAPSWVVEVKRGAGEDSAPQSALVKGWRGDYHVQTLYQSDGSQFPSSSTGAVDNSRRIMYVTGLYGKGIVEIEW